MPQGGTESRPSRPLETGGVRDEQKNRLLGLPLMMQRFGFKEDGLGFPGPENTQLTGGRLDFRPTLKTA